MDINQQPTLATKAKHPFYARYRNVVLTGVAPLLLGGATSIWHVLPSRPPEAPAIYRQYTAALEVERAFKDMVVPVANPAYRNPMVENYVKSNNLTEIVETVEKDIDHMKKDPALDAYLKQSARNEEVNVRRFDDSVGLIFGGCVLSVITSGYLLKRRREYLKEHPELPRDI
jgi:hypothetical protein